MEPRAIDSKALPWLPHRNWTGVYTRPVMAGGMRTDLEVKEIRITPGAEIPSHAHERSTETFYVLSGEGNLQVGDQSMPCQAGSCAYALPGTAHGVKNTGQDDLQLLAIFTPPLNQGQKPEAELYKVAARVISVEGACGFGHQVGDEILFDGQTVSGRICLSALYSFLPKVFAMRHGADFPWLDAEHKDVATHACPDAQNPVVFEIRRFREAQDRETSS